MIIKLENVSPQEYAGLCKFLESKDNTYYNRTDCIGATGVTAKFATPLKARTPEKLDYGKLLVELQIVDDRPLRTHMLKLFDALNIFPERSPELVR
ncbi:MAG: hypothetical protein HY226_02505 [Candidatus Vogelbacteria bacterium]|nr:hypothetical protein [Candidatus Vogelbacteria bacterium]